MAKYGARVHARVDRSAYEPQFRQVARILREEIERGAYLPGELLPSERELAETLGTSKDTVRDGLKVLRARGLVVTLKGVGTRVMDRQEVVEYPIPPGARVTARLPLAQERHRLRIPEGVPVFVVEVKTGEPLVLPADRTALLGGG